MAEPKKRTNRSKRNMRRMHDKVAAPSINYCSNCHQAVAKHQVCPACGFYRGSNVIVKEEKVQIKEQAES